MGKLFGTDGVRGVANAHPMSAEMALAIGRATAAALAKNSAERARIVVGRDTRVSGNMLESALAAGICSMGADALLAGCIPTPGVAFLARSLGCAAGIVISASHNPFEDNGIKVFNADGCKLNDETEARIEQLALSNELDGVRPEPARIGRVIRAEDAAAEYVEFCKQSFPAEQTLAGLKIVLDCANGAASSVAPKVFSGLGADIAVIHAAPDGININKDCGSQHTRDLSAKVVELGADLGLAFDGDADRLIAVDENGVEITGDHVIAICAKSLMDRGLLPKNTVVITPMSNLGLRLAFDKMGIRWLDAGIGDRNVLDLMQKEGAAIGGEQSGHVIFLDKHSTGDGIISALQLLAVVRASGKKLSELAEIFTTAPQTLVNLIVREKPPLESLPEVAAAIASAEASLAGRGRVLVRYSGTQPMCRVMVEAESQSACDSIAAGIVELVKKSIG